MNTPAADSAWAPLTEAQEGLWYAQRLDPANPIFNPAHRTVLRGPLDVPRFERAVNQALSEAESLSLRFEDRPDGPAQRLDPARAPRLDIRDLRHLPATRAQEQADDWIRKDLRRPVDPVRDPLSRQVLFLCGPALALWYQRVHHLAADGYGMALIEGRAIRLYRALGEDTADREPPLAPLAPVWDEDRAWRADPKRAQAREFWLAQCAGHVPAASLAAGSALSAHDCLRMELDASAALVESLQALETATDIGWPDLLTALGAAYVARHLGPSACVTGVPAMGRLGSRSARAVATVMNVLPWAWTPDEDAPLADTLRDAARSLRGLRRHGRYRAEHLRRDLALPGGLPRLHGPILNVLPFDAPYEAAGLDASQAVLCTGPVEDLTLGFRAAPDGGGLRLEIEANPALYTEAQARAHLRRLEAFLAAALAAPRLADVPTLTADEHERWALAPNRTGHPVPDGTLWSRIRDRLRTEPGHVGLEDEAGAWTYADIDAWTARAASRLRALGAGPGALAAVALPRSALRVLCMLAILRSGAAYLPLDPRQPAARLRGILDDARARVLIGPGALCEGLDTRPLAADTLGDPEPADETDDAARAGADAGSEDPAYVIYTSGSTGAPKGVIVPHAAIVNRLEWMRAHYAIGPEDRILQKTPATFDVSVWELFLPFLSGARLVVAPPDAHRDPAWLCRLVRERRITVLHFVPSMLAAVLDEPAARGLAARLVFCSGEALPAALRDRFHRTFQAELHNLYGPTEAAVDVSYWPAGADDDSQPVPIGWPVWNTRLHVLDERLRPVPPGTPGQLYLGGRQLATGYLGRPDLTAERFVPAPAGLPDDRLYATGDLATRREDCAVVYLGRLDHQVKLRGQRIELGEIEAALAAHPDVAQAAVLAREDRPGQTLLAAYVVPEAGRAFDRDALAAHMAGRLPDYMVPTAWVPLAALPVTANGKLDRKALPAPGLSGPETSRPPRTAAEHRVAKAFRAVLGLPDPPGADDDFFALGGHSLLAARLALALRDGHDLSLGTVFQYPTVARLAAHLEDGRARAPGAAQAGFGPVVTLREAAGRPALFCIHPAGGLSWCYGALARALPTPRTVHGLQASALALDGQPPADSLAALARAYADRVLSLQAEGPYHLAGWSVGGILAQAVAAELQARGRAVGVVALLDAYPCEAWRDRPEPAPEDLYKALLHIAGADPDALPPERLSRAGVIEFLRAQGHPLGELSDARLDAVFETVGHTNRLVRGHRHTRYDGPALHFQAALDHVDSGLDPDLWLPHVGALARHAVDSTHAGLPGAAATAHIAPVLDACLRTADRGAPVAAPA